MILKTQISNIVNTNSAKHLHQAIIKHPEINQWINQQCNGITGLDTMSEKIRYVLHGETPICSVSNKKKRWINLSSGWGFCGRAADCDCARESVSKKVSLKKQAVTPTEQLHTNLKRTETNLERYGVANAAQTAAAKTRHREFYLDESAVERQIQKQKATLIERYGVDNAMKSEDVKRRARATIKERYGVDNINQLPERRSIVSENSQKAWVKRKESNFDYHRLNQKFENICHVKFVTPPEQYLGVMGNNRYRFECIRCQNQFETWIENGHLPICKTCHPTVYSFKSGEENEIYAYIQSLGIAVEQRNRTLINPYELDMICRDQHIAIEYCGLYWHSEASQGRTREYHINKMTQCNLKGYRLITIFSDEWTRKKEIVKSKLAAILGKSHDKIGARRCSIKSISNDIARKFYDTWHLQGAVNSEINIGLYHNNTLVACMSFGPARAFTNNQKTAGTYELLRYASSINVIGGASRLLRAFEQQYNPKMIYSYADARWSNGNLYTKIGFSEKISPISAGYWYTQDYSTRIHRFAFTKSRLVKDGHDSSLTEWQIMQSLGYDRIWDCGQFKFTKKY